MSDGNYNRALLPASPLAAGLRTGKAQMRQRALRALGTLITRHRPDLDPTARQQLLDEFAALLRER